jgi:hypothetical protein
MGNLRQRSPLAIAHEPEDAFGLIGQTRLIALRDVFGPVVSGLRKQV